MTSRTEPCGTANVSLPTLAISASVIASVTGSSRTNRVPAPGVVSSDSDPESCSTAALTTPMPTPRPLARSDSSRVEKPGAHSSDSRCVRVRRSLRHLQARGLRARDHRLGVDAPPVVGDFHPHDVSGRRGAEDNGAFGTLAGGDALLHGFDAVADRVAHEMEDRIHHPLDQELVDLRALSPQLEPHPLAGLARQIADDERHAAEDLADRDQAHAHDAFAQRAELPVDRDGVLLDRAPLARRDPCLDARQRIGQPGPADHEIADVAHQVVEAREIHADKVRRRHARGR